jgi:hypothetical protein
MLINTPRRRKKSVMPNHISQGRAASLLYSRLSPRTKHSKSYILEGRQIQILCVAYKYNKNCRQGGDYHCDCEALLDHI